VRIVSDFLRNLIGRELSGESGGESGLRPRLPSLFEREPAAMQMRIDGEALETPTIEEETTPQPMPWRRLRSDAPAAAAIASPPHPAPSQTLHTASIRARARHAEPPPIEDTSRPAAATSGPMSERRATTPTPSPASVRQTAATHAPLRAESQRTIATDTEPSPHAAALRVDAQTPRAAGFVPHPPQQPLPMMPLAAQRTHIVASEADEPAASRTSLRTRDRHHDEFASAAPYASAQTSPGFRTQPPLRSMAPAQTRASEAPAETVINVSIGRIEVRAAPQTRASAGNANDGKRRAPRPTSLEDYLRERQSGRET
jgi:hypothetical protein